jgi:hypothetical protein
MYETFIKQHILRENLRSGAHVLQGTLRSGAQFSPKLHNFMKVLLNTRPEI